MSLKRKTVSYFAAGPAKLPREVLEEVQKDIIYYEDTNVSILEMSHRSKTFEDIVNRTKALVTELLNVPDNYEILFLQGGGTGQFSAVPMNLLTKNGFGSYAVTGSWSSKAAKECSNLGESRKVFPTPKKFNGVPRQSEWKIDSEAAYVFYCDNETINGIEFDFIPEVPKNIPLVSDMSSNICSRVFDVSKFGLIFAGAQKNMGCAGVTLVIVRKDLIGETLKCCSPIFNYKIMAAENSLFNTPPAFAIRVLEKYLVWLKKNGGVEGMEELAKKKSEMLYTLIDDSEQFYCNLIDINARSRMNVIFRVGGPDGSDALEKTFLVEAEKEGLLALKGHRSVGGLRASLYNAVTLEDVTRLCDFMNKFLADHKM